jgi:hypothetical protein
MKKINFPKLFYRYLQLWKYHTLFTWHEQENLWHKVHFEAFHPERCGFCVYFRLKVDHKDAARRSCRRERKTPNAALWVRLATTYADIKELVVNKGMLHDTAFPLLSRATCSV